MTKFEEILFCIRKRVEIIGFYVISFPFAAVGAVIMKTGIRLRSKLLCKIGSVAAYISMAYIKYLFADVPKELMSETVKTETGTKTLTEITEENDSIMSGLESIVLGEDK